MYTLYKRIFLLLFVSALFWVAACRKDKPSDFDALSGAMAGLHASYYEHAVAVLLNDSFFHVTNSYTNIPVKLTAAASVNDTVYAVVDTALITSYNSMFSENNPIIPANAFVASNNGKFAIAAGHAESVDSLHVQLNNATQLKDSAIYLVPVRLSGKSGISLQPSVIFYKVQVTFQTLKAKMTGGSNNPFIFNRVWFFSPSVRINSDGSVTGPGVIKIAVGLNAPFPFADVYVNAGVYNDTTTLYEFSRYYTPYPDNSFSIANKRIRIPANSLKGVDSIELTLSNFASLKKYTSYLLAVKLTSETGSVYSVPVSKDSSAAYFSIFPF
ncbi:protein of unknown function [Filimonas lacunae]|uniref:BT-3987-like N-terminal domain-containing protein n=1 Tax=Filimonas lacunae TaxID=477680 RepID=A0A173MIS0_9BACT|nr:DUF1735 domain-containing protein [Filimonas lacunae]BAV07357.1 hypothetical protein FLA_3380 [Filimonas lacunae]SIS90835.1 protein of unknown function [Filimonas lacunae]